MSVIGSLSVKLGLITVDWSQATEKAKKEAKDLQKSIDELGGGVQQLSNLWKTLGGSLSIGAIGFSAILEQTIAFTNEISDLAKGMGLTIGQTVAFRDALTGAGASADGAAKMMSTLFSKIDEAQKGNDTTIAQFEKLGISFQDLKKMSPYDAVQKVAEGFSNISNQFEKVKLIKNFFGKAGIGMDIDEVSRILGEGTAKADKYAASIEKVGVIGDNVKRSFDNLKIAFADLISPFVRDNIVSIDKFSAILKGLATTLIIGQITKMAISIGEVAIALKEAAAAGAVFNAVAGGFSPVGLALKVAGMGIGYLVYQNSMSAAPKFEQTNVGQTIDKYDSAEAEALRKQEEREVLASKEAETKRAQVILTQQLIGLESQKAAIQLQQIGNENYILKMRLEDISAQEKIVQLNAKRAQELETNREGSEALKAQINALADAEIKRANAGAVANKKQIQAAGEYKSLLQHMQDNPTFRQLETRDAETIKADSIQQNIARSQAMADLRDQMRSSELVGKRLEYEKNIIDLLPIQQEFLLKQFDLEANITEWKRQQKYLGQTDSWINERAEQLKALGEEQIKLKQETVEYQRTFQYGWKTAFDSYMDNATNAGKLAGDSFNSITSNMNSAIDNFVKTGKLSFKDLARSIIQDLIAIQMKASASGLFGMLLKGLGLGGNVGDASNGASGIGTGIQGIGSSYADGGSPTPNTVNLVGENGPELFIPRQAGTIIPNGALSGMGGTTNVTNNYINAIDTKSFEERILGSSTAVWAANQYGAKSLATTTGRT
jgi:lambda family phage tail tape measure protein